MQEGVAHNPVVLQATGAEEGEMAAENQGQSLNLRPHRYLYRHHHSSERW